MNSIYLNSTRVFNNSKESIDFNDLWNLPSPVDCRILKFIGTYCILLLALSLLFNTSLILIIYKQKNLHTSLNMLIITLTVYNLIASLIELPFVIISNFKCRWPFGKLGCHFSGVIMYIIGTIQIYLMTAILFERFLIIYKPLKTQVVRWKTIILMICICTAGGVIWGVLPYFGWSYYSLEGALTSCSVEWYERSFNVISYNIAMFIFVFFLPFVIILLTTFKLFLTIKNLPLAFKSYRKNGRMDRKTKLERRLTIIIIFFILGFLISWTPYGIVSLYRSFIGKDLPPLAGTLPAMFAKSTLVWSSIYYIYLNKQIRSQLIAFFISSIRN